MFDLVIPIGRFQENTPGASYLVAKMLMEGTKSKSSADIANALDYHGSHLEISPTLDHVFVRLYCLKKFFQNQLDLIFELLTDSVFPAKEFEKLKNIRIQQIRQQHAKSNAFAGLKFREALFGKDHPYGKLIQPEDVKGTSLEEVLAFYSTSFVAKPTVFLAGDVNKAEVAMIKSSLSSLSFSKPELTKVSPVSGERKISISWENSVQSSLRIGSQCIAKSHPEIHEFQIANELLGGFFGSRLMKNIREEKGLTYGISSNMVHLQEGSYWVIGTDILKEKAPLAIEEIKKEIAKLQATPPSQNEVDTLKSYLKGKWLMSFDSCFNSMNLITNNYLAGLTAGYWGDLMQSIDQMTPDKISEITRKHIHVDALFEVRVG